MSNVIILLGAPGSGKGTQAELISNEYNYKIHSMGDIVRSEMKNKTTLGEQMSTYIKNGDLVPDDLINNIFINQLSSEDKQNGFISDGYPRTLNQAILLDKLLNEKELNPIIILMDVPKDVLIDRLMNRKRFDDTLDVIKNRLSTYNNEVSSIIEYYNGRINAIQSNTNIDNVFSEIKVVINNA